MQILKKRYPKTSKLGGGPIMIRPMESKDQKTLLEFFKRIPIDDRRLLKDDVLDAKTIAAWCKNLDYERVLPLLAFDGKRVVADATLHRERGWMCHVARVRAVVDPAYRGRGIGRALVREFLEMAQELRIAVVDAEIMAEQRAGLKMFEELNFVVVATLPQHALDLVGKAHDVVVLSNQIFSPAEIAVDRDTRIEDVDLGGGG